MLATADQDATEEVSTIEDTRPLRTLVKIRNIENGPAEIEEARSRGLIVPVGENAQEWHKEVKERLGWFWAYDPRVQETRVERRERYLADDRQIDMKGFARVILRSYATVRDNKYESDSARRLVDDDAELTSVAELHLPGTDSTLEQVKARLLAEQREKLLKAMPPPRDRIGQSSLWLVSDAVAYGRRTQRLDKWYEKARILQPGRPVGSRTRNRRAR